MESHNEKAMLYRNKAEELRAMIPDFTDGFTRKILEKIAADYDHLATVQERLASSERVGGKF